MTLRAPNGSIDLGTAFITGGSLTLESRDNMNLGGANIAGNLSMSSTQGSVSFGSATVQGSLSANTQGQQIDLGTATVGQNLVVQSNGGNIVQSSSNGARLTVWWHQQPQRRHGQYFVAQCAQPVCGRRQLAGQQRHLGRYQWPHLGG